MKIAAMVFCLEAELLPPQMYLSGNTRDQQVSKIYFRLRGEQRPQMMSFGWMRRLMARRTYQTNAQ
jgi:hypothetical protein